MCIEGGGAGHSAWEQGQTCMDSQLLYHTCMINLSPSEALTTAYKMMKLQSQKISYLWKVSPLRKVLSAHKSSIDR